MLHLPDLVKVGGLFCSHGEGLVFAAEKLH